MKSIIVLLLSIGCFCSVYSQNTIVTGMIIDISKKPVSYANIIFKAVDNPKSIYGILADENGRFSIEVPKQAYNLEVSVVGITPTISSLDLSTAEHKSDLGDIIIDTDVLLDEVVVTANTTNYKIELDKKVYNVSKRSVCKWWQFNRYYAECTFCASGS